jgi:cytochrome oxidase Cu insertion factor (SCO1/SenC/PrrC family)
VDSAPKHNGRLTLLLIAGLPLTMILAASWLWYFVARGDLDIVGTLGTANRGELLQPPRQLAAQDLRQHSGEPLAFAELEPQWTLVVPHRGTACEARCEQLLYLTRQIHLAMGKEYNRIRRFFVTTTPVGETRLEVESLSDDHPVPASFADYLAAEHPRLQALEVAPATLKQLFAEHETAPDTWYLVDPAGWVMMSYDDSVSYKDVMADLKFLLKNSS